MISETTFQSDYKILVLNIFIFLTLIFFLSCSKNVAKESLRQTEQGEVIGYKDENDAIEIANESEYGLSGYISSSNQEKAISIARKIRTGMVHVNYAPVNQLAPFGGYKKSGNGREWGVHGIEDFLEIKSIIGTN